MAATATFLYKKFGGFHRPLIFLLLEDKMNLNRDILTIKSTSIVMAGSQLLINIPAVTLVNHQEFKLILCQPIPANAGVSQVLLQTPTQTIEMRVRTGNYLRADQIKCRRCYDMVYGTDPVHASMLCCLKRSCYDVAFPSGTTTAAAPASSTAEESGK